jgi:RelB Antitoxin alpha helical domain
MRSFKKKYIVNEHNEKVAVQLDIKTFENIERLLEDAMIANKISENKTADRLSLAEARAFYLNHKGSKTLKITKN